MAHLWWYHETGTGPMEALGQLVQNGAVSMMPLTDFQMTLQEGTPKIVVLLILNFTHKED